MYQKTIRFFLIVKRNLTTPGYLFSVIIFLLLLFFLNGIKLPKQENTKVGICCNESEAASKIFDTLSNSDSQYTFLSFDTEDTIKKKVITGELECGFVFREDFDKIWKKGKLKESILYYASPHTKNGLLIQEEIYSIIYKEISAQILLNGMLPYYNEFSPQMKERLFELNLLEQEYDGLISLDLQGFEYNDNSAPQGSLGTDSNLVRYKKIICYSFILVIIYLAMGEKWNKENNYILCLNSSEKYLYYFQEFLAAGLLPIFICTIYLSEPMEILSILFFYIFSSIWCLVLSTVIHTYNTFISCLPMILLTNLALCPMVYDLSSIISALEFLQYLFPMGWLK